LFFQDQVAGASSCIFHNSFELFKNIYIVVEKRKRMIIAVSGCSALEFWRRAASREAVLKNRQDFTAYGRENAGFYSLCQRNDQNEDEVVT